MGLFISSGFVKNLFFIICWKILVLVMLRGVNLDLE